MKQLLFILVLAVASTASHATQVLDLVDGGTLFVRISAKGQTRFAVERGRIASIRLPRGSVLMEPDDETGQVFLTVPDTTKNPVSGFLTTESGQTLTVTLVPSDIPTETVIFRLPAQPASNTKAPFARNGNPFEREVKRLYNAMLNGAQMDGVDVKDVHQPVMLWAEASMILERQYVAPNVIGDCFRVTNVSQTQMVLGEHEFYRKGVNAVAIEQLNLAPGAATRVCVIREKAINE